MSSLCTGVFVMTSQLKNGMCLRILNHPGHRLADPGGFRFTAAYRGSVGSVVESDPLVAPAALRRKHVITTGAPPLPRLENFRGGAPGPGDRHQFCSGSGKHPISRYAYLDRQLGCTSSSGQVQRTGVWVPMWSRALRPSARRRVQLVGHRAHGRSQSAHR